MTGYTWISGDLKPVTLIKTTDEDRILIWKGRTGIELPLVRSGDRVWIRRNAGKESIYPGQHIVDIKILN